MGKRREMFFREQYFVWQGIEVIKSIDSQARSEKEGPGKLNEVTSPDSISMSMLLGWEDVMPSLASQSSHGNRRKLYPADSDYSEKVEEMKEATDSTDTNFAHSSQHSFCAGHVNISSQSLLTLHEAVAVCRHMRQFELPRDVHERTDSHCNFNVDQSTEYGRRLVQVSNEMRAYDQENSAENA
jgi:hypothetical protein